MAVDSACPFEWRIGTAGGTVEPGLGSNPGLVGTASISTAQARTGVSSLRCNPASGASGYCSTGSVAKYSHFGLYVATLPSVDRLIAGQISAGIINLRLTTTGAIAVYNNTTLIGTSSTTPFSATGWHWIAYRQVTGTSVAFLQIDGVDAVTGTSTVTSTSSIIGFSGTEASAVDAYFDDYINDGAGLLAPSKVDVALPISDNTVTGVTDNNGGTTNIWQCVSNVPPAGVASANEAANPKKGMHYPASTTCSYIANLETYTTLGVGASDTLLAVQGYFRHGEDIATGTKNGTYVGITNPTHTDNTAFTFGTDGGAHGAETGLWAGTNAGTVVTSPSVTLDTSPTIRVDRASESRLGCVDAMGLFVVWTPAPAVVTPMFRGIVNFQNPGIL